MAGKLERVCLQVEDSDENFAVLVSGRRRHDRGHQR